MSPKQKRFKLLLDEMLPRREKFPLADNFHNVRHIVHDFKKAGVSDNEVLKMAKNDARILVTKNVKDFQKICRQYEVDIIGVTETIPPEILDKLIVAKLKKWAKEKMSGRFTKIINPPRKKS